MGLAVRSLVCRKVKLGGLWGWTGVVERVFSKERNNEVILRDSRQILLQVNPLELCY